MMSPTARVVHPQTRWQASSAAMARAIAMEAAEAVSSIHRFAEFAFFGQNRSTTTGVSSFTINFGPFPRQGCLLWRHDRWRRHNRWRRCLLRWNNLWRWGGRWLIIFFHYLRKIVTELENFWVRCLNLSGVDSRKEKPKIHCSIPLTCGYSECWINSWISVTWRGLLDISQLDNSTKCLNLSHKPTANSWINTFQNKCVYKCYLQLL